MALYYRLPGLVADVAVLIYAALTLALYRSIPLHSPCPYRGFLLSTGSALDANILIFERLKEELRDGRSLHMAIEQGWKTGLAIIRDANIATLITCGILYYFGSVVWRHDRERLFGDLAGRYPRQPVYSHCGHPHFTDPGSWLPQANQLRQMVRFVRGISHMMNILGKRYWFFLVSLLIIIPGLVLAIVGLPLSIDFTGGSLLEVTFESGKAPQPCGYHCNLQ